jgi:hypothetical protein
MALSIIALVFAVAGGLLLWLTEGGAQLLGVAILAAALTILFSGISGRGSIHFSSLPMHGSRPALLHGTGILPVHGETV